MAGFSAASPAAATRLTLATLTGATAFPCTKSDASNDAALTDMAAFSLQLLTSLADGEYSGITIPGTAGAAIIYGDIVYLAAADSRWELADASAAATAGDVKLGCCVLAAASDGDPTVILLFGNVRANAAFPSMTISAPLYISETAGDVTHTKPTTTDAVIRRLGFANTADELFFCPSSDFITHV
jgi:hypothetical protein